MLDHQITLANIPKNTGWFNDENLWISIPKNANTQMQKICKDLGIGCGVIPTSGTTFKTTVCVLRNPATRVISGLGEFKARNKRKTETIQQLLEELIEDPLQFDEHLEPQLVFMAGHSYTNILMFESLLQELQTIPTFRYNNIRLRQRIDPIRLNMSKHFYPDSIEKIYFDNQVGIDHVVNKHYQRDLEMWLEPQSYINKLIE